MVTLRKRDDHRATASELSNNRVDALEILRVALSNSNYHRGTELYTDLERGDRVAPVAIHIAGE